MRTKDEEYCPRNELENGLRLYAETEKHSSVVNVAANGQPPACDMDYPQMPIDDPFWEARKAILNKNTAALKAVLLEQLDLVKATDDSRNGRTLLYLACSCTRSLVANVKLLLQLYPKAASIQDRRNITPRHIAISCGAPRAIRDNLSVTVTVNTSSCSENDIASSSSQVKATAQQDGFKSESISSKEEPRSPSSSAVGNCPGPGPSHLSKRRYYENENENENNEASPTSIMSKKRRRWIDLPTVTTIA
jgi:ankyrin repeat protein